MILANKQHTKLVHRPIPPIVLSPHPPLRARLFVSYYVPTNPERAHEIDTCLFFNVSNPEIDEVFVLCDVTTPLPISIEPYISKVTKIDYPHRVLICDMIDIINKHSHDNTLNMFGNSDIILSEDGVRIAKEYLTPKHAFALTRKNLIESIHINTPRNALKGNVHEGTTDVWMVQGTCKIPTMELNVHFGTLGCDPLLNSILRSKYIVLNPYEKVSTYHYHLSTNTNNYHGPGIREVGTTVSYPRYTHRVIFANA